jgi:hypothetical protein
MLSTRYSCHILMRLEFSRQIFKEKKPKYEIFINIRPVGVELFHEERRTDRRTNGHDEANRRSPQF